MKKILFIIFLFSFAFADAQNTKSLLLVESSEKFYGCRSEALADERAFNMTILPQPKDSTLMILISRKNPLTRLLFAQQDDNSWNLFGAYTDFEDQNFGVKFLSTAVRGGNGYGITPLFNHKPSN